MPPSNERRFRTVWEGFVFAHALTLQTLTLRLFRIIPIACVRLDRVVYIRQRSGEDLRDLFRLGRCWYWPHPWFMGRPGFDHAPYVVRLVDGGRVFVRMRHSFHYLMREGVGRLKAEASGAE
jgi:hypothetical protein